MYRFVLRITALFLLFGCSLTHTQAQLQVSPLTGAPATYAQQLAQALVGQGVQVQNAVLTGHPSASGFFTSSGSGIGISSGILLTTGNIQNAPGPNNQGGNTPGYTNSHGRPGDPDLNSLVTLGSTEDACVLEFDVLPIANTLTFSYVFASEEYPEYSCSEFNDVFGFFISGPGITGKYNMARIPGSSQPVAINNLHPYFLDPYTGPCQPANLPYFVDNGNGSTPMVNTTVQYDGFTTRLVAQVTNLRPCATYRLKLAIADIGDDLYDSGVFIEQGSLTATPLSFAARTDLGAQVPHLAEGCVAGRFVFRRAAAAPFDLPVSFSIRGSAQNGIDYTGPNGQPLDSTITIPAGADSVVLELLAVNDQEPELPETVVLRVKGICQTAGVIDTVFLQIQDTPARSCTGSAAICPGGSMPLHASGGLQYSWSPATGLSDPSSAQPVASPAVSTLYTLVTQFGSCQGRDSVWVNVQQAPRQPAGPDLEVCAGSSAQLAATGGASYAWSGPNGFSSTLPALQVPATASCAFLLTLTDSVGCRFTDTVQVRVLPVPQLILTHAISLCAGDTVPVPATITGSLSGVQTVWSPGRGLSDSLLLAPLASPAVPTWYTLTAKAGLCAARDSVFIQPVARPVNLQITSSALTGMAPLPIDFSATATNAASFEWNFGDPTSAENTATGSSVRHTFSQKGSYRVLLIARNAIGCTATAFADSITVRSGSPVVQVGNPSGEQPVPQENPELVPPVETEEVAEVMNAFSPNGDNVNEVFFINGLRPQTEVAVFNRWGAVVYESKNYQNDWTAPGLQAGVYLYQVSIPGRDKALKGWVEIIR